MSEQQRHLCIFTTAHPTDDVRVHSRIAASFLGGGWRVSWVGPRNSYFLNTETPNDRIEYHLFEPNDSKYRRMTAARRAAAMAAHVEDVDWWYAPDPDAAAHSVKLARRLGGRVVFDIHEVFHGALLDRWFPITPPSAVREIVKKRIQRTCRKVDLVIGVSRAVLSPYITEPSAGVVVRNCAPRWFAGVDGAQAIGDSVRVRVMHGKTLPTNGASLVVDAVEKLDVETARRLEIYMSQPGGGESQFSISLRERVAATANRQVVSFNEGVPHEEMPRVLKSCQIGMIGYPRDLGVDSLPNRLFEYMACGLAILAPTYAVEIAEIVTSEAIGLLVDFEEPDDVARALEWLVKNPAEVRTMGNRAMEAFIERYNWPAEARKLQDAIGCQEGRKA